MPNTRLLDVTFATTIRSSRRRSSIRTSHNFIEQNFRSRYQATTQASNWLAGQLDELKAKVETSEDARINYERANQIWTIDEKEDVTTQKLGDINKELTEAQADRINKEAVYQLAQIGKLRCHSSGAGEPSHSGHLEAAKRAERPVHGCPQSVRTEVSQGGPAARTDQGSGRRSLPARKTTSRNQIEAEYRGSRQRELVAAAGARSAEDRSLRDGRQDGAVQHPASAKRKPTSSSTTVCCRSSRRPASARACVPATSASWIRQ